MQDIIITVEHLSKSFDDFTAVDDISLTVPEGQIFGFLGPNGAGKTTSLKMLIGLLQPSKGHILINGTKPNSDEIKDRIGVIPQDIVLWEDLTIEENLHFVASIYKIDKTVATQRVASLIEEVHLHEKRSVLVKNLSGGLKRRLNIIMGLVHDPDIVVCDEPTPGLDAQSRALVWTFIRDLSRKKGKTVILTTHFMEEADRLSDLITIIDKGKLLITDTPENLRNSIGEGDIIELQINDDALLDTAVAQLADYPGCDEVLLVDSFIQVRALNGPSKLAGILNQIERIDGLEVKDMKIRKSTLEDVFLYLTGRQLRD